MSGCKSDSWLFGAHSIGRTYAWVSCPLYLPSRYSLNFKKDAILRFATDVYLVEKEEKEDAVEKMRRYFVTRNLNVHTRYVTITTCCSWRWYFRCCLCPFPTLPLFNLWRSVPNQSKKGGFTAFIYEYMSQVSKRLLGLSMKIWMVLVFLYILLRVSSLKTKYFVAVFVCV